MQHNENAPECACPSCNPAPVETVKVRHVYTFPDFAQELADECATELVEEFQAAQTSADDAAEKAAEAQSSAEDAASAADDAATEAANARDTLDRLRLRVQELRDDEARRKRWMQHAQEEAYQHGFNAGWLAAMSHARKATEAVPEVVK